MNKLDQISDFEKELREIAPELAKLPRVEQYPVPEGYFEQLSARASELARNLGLQKPPALRRLINVRTVAVAAGMLLIALLVWKFRSGQEHVQLAVNDANAEEIISYLDNRDVFGFHEDELMDAIIALDTGNNAENAGVSLSDDDLNTDENLKTEPSREDLIDYLLDEGIDLDLIIEEAVKENSANG